LVQKFTFDKNIILLTEFGKDKEMEDFGYQTQFEDFHFSEQTNSE